MGKKIFVTYKYSDPKVKNLPNNYLTTARDYVNALQDMLENEDHIYKGENDSESLEEFKDDTIASKLKGKIFDSSITVIFISKGMKEENQPEADQWIPWEISYSLKELTRDQKTSKSNAVLAVVLPDENGSYSYFITYNEHCDSIFYNTPSLFKIIRKNMFNLKKPETTICNGATIYHGYFSYIFCVLWDDFKSDMDKYIDIANQIKDNIDDYNITKTVD